MSHEWVNIPALHSCVANIKYKQKPITATISLDIYLLVCIKTATMQPDKDSITYNFKV